MVFSSRPSIFWILIDSASGQAQCSCQVRCSWCVRQAVEVQGLRDLDLRAAEMDRDVRDRTVAGEFSWKVVNMGKVAQVVSPKPSELLISGPEIYRSNHASVNASRSGSGTDFLPWMQRSTVTGRFC